MSVKLSQAAAEFVQITNRKGYLEIGNAHIKEFLEYLVNNNDIEIKSDILKEENSGAEIITTEET